MHAHLCHILAHVCIHTGASHLCTPSSHMLPVAGGGEVSLHPAEVWSFRAESDSANGCVDAALKSDYQTKRLKGLCIRLATSTGVCLLTHSVAPGSTRSAR